MGTAGGLGAMPARAVRRVSLMAATSSQWEAWPTGMGQAMAPSAVRSATSVPTASSEPETATTRGPFTAATDTSS